jgi:hypothetical protein
MIRPKSSIKWCETMSYCGKKTSKHGLLILSMLVLLSGCGMETSSESSSSAVQPQGSTEPTVEIAGAAMKGVIRQGLVTATRLIADKDDYYAPQRLAAKPVLTAEDGSYEFKLRGNAEGWALVELQANSGTRMLCDVVPECQQADASSVAFGQSMTLDSNFSLKAAGDLSLGNANLTPLTHLAIALAERSANGLSPEALASAYTTVEGWFGLADGAMRLDPPDLTRLDDLDSVAADALQVAIANAAFLALVNDNAQWNSISDVLNNITSQVTQTGEISILGNGTNVALADLVSAGAVQAAELQATVDSSVISQKLVVVEYRNVQRFKTIADVYGDTGTDIADADDTASDPVSPDEPIETNPEEPIEPTPEEPTDPVADTGTGNDTSEPTPTDTTPANTALLSWTAPLTRENGESLALSEIAGFEVVYGLSADSLDQSLAIGDSSVDELLVDELTEGTWYFAIRTLDTDGNRSRLSDVVNKQI